MNPTWYPSSFCQRFHFSSQLRPVLQYYILFGFFARSTYSESTTCFGFKPFFIFLKFGIFLLYIYFITIYENCHYNHEKRTNMPFALLFGPWCLNIFCRIKPLYFYYMMLPIIYMNLLLCMFKSVTFTILYFAFFLFTTSFAANSKVQVQKPRLKRRILKSKCFGLTSSSFATIIQRLIAITLFPSFCLNRYSKEMLLE